MDPPTETAAPPDQLYDAVKNIDVDQQPALDQHDARPPHSSHDSLDDTLGGIEGSPHVASSSNGHHHGQPQALDPAAPNSPRYDDEHANRHTPPVSGAHPASRPGSQMSNPSSSNPLHQAHCSEPGSQAPSDPPNGRNHVVIKVGMVGDAQIGKTSLMVKYVEGSWDEDYIQTLGVNFMEKTISIRNTEITFSIWDLGGQREFVNMLPLVCNDAVAILFMFDLTRKSTLNSIKEWYRQGRGFNKTAIPILVGTKYDHFVNFPIQDQEEISNQVGPTEARAGGGCADQVRRDDSPRP